MSSEEEKNPEHTEDTASFSNWFRTWRYLFILVALVISAFLFYAEENWRGYHAWQAYKIQMAARGEATEPETFIPPPAPDDENFAITPALNSSHEYRPRDRKSRNPKVKAAFEPFTEKYDDAANLVKKPPQRTRHNSWIGPGTDLGNWSWAFSQQTNADPKQEETDHISQLSVQDAASDILTNLSDFTPVLEELRAASHKPRSRFNLNYAEENPAMMLLPHLAKIKYLCQVLQLRASAELALNRTDDAQADIELMFRLVDACKEEPIIISHLVRFASLQLALQPFAEGMGKWSDLQLLAFQRRLQKFDFLTDLRWALRGEQIFFGNGVIEFVRRSASKARVVDSLSGSGDNPNAVAPMLILVTAAPSGWLYLEQLHYTRLFDETMLPVIDLTNRVIRPEAVDHAEKVIAQMTTGSPAARFIRHELFSSMMLPALTRSAEKACLSQTGVDLATIACALERYRLANSQYPDSLEKLVPQFIEALPHDVINGKPLNYSLKTDGHYVLYSVGWNQKDDGGTIKQTKSSVDQKQGDWVWSDLF